MEQIDEKTLNFIKNVPMSTETVCKMLNLSTSTYNRYINENKLKKIENVGDLIIYLNLRNIDML